MKKIVLLFIILFSNNLYSSESLTTSPMELEVIDYEDLLGSTPHTLITSLGSPDYIYSERGNDLKDDDVVFFYNKRLYIYFNNNRAWQVRLDREFTEKVADISIGDDLDTVLNTLGDPIETIENSIIYTRPDQGYPVFMRLYFKNKKLDDIYFYRGDY